MSIGSAAVAGGAKSDNGGDSIAQLKETFKKAQELAIETQSVTTLENGKLGVNKKQINA